ncbi:AAA family ATPase [Cyanobium sp. NS01]|uniref:AAA family ATPase n=1 Tax=Cyanobium sp. NS01 TaxID=261284 RepID=UPI00186070B9|nr:AAA family ATPase [Cyanobium sp. NS01]QNI70870.1 AAA ATPase domain protein [Cyanobium sp. NS01]
MPIEMKLTRFRVTAFRSVEDSGWIDVDDVTALIGTNESGKSNLLLPLWKLNPAKEGEIHPTSDFPRKHFTAFRNANPKPVFIEAEFAVHGALRTHLARKAGLSEDLVEKVTIRRRLDGRHEIDFPLAPQEQTVLVEDLAALLESAAKDIASAKQMKTEQGVCSSILDSITTAQDALPEESECGLDNVSELREILSSVSLQGAPKTSAVIPRFKRLQQQIEEHYSSVSRDHPSDSEEVKKLILGSLPKFVYYSNYGNLDSEIYLPHVIQNLNRLEGLGQKERAKARTLKVLFEFVELQPTEILSLGKDIHPPGQQPSEEQVEQSAQKKKERSILLQSASTRLTEEFRRWWKQGDYRFRFEADGDHFRIWVADDRRPEEVELEGRSTGLQWFLSFYLVFLVESQDTHSGCILLLDEPGLSLHPLAQRDLSDFFDGLAERNQLMYTTHSPFLVDADRLDRVRKVFVAPDGTSKATSDLGADGGDPTKRGAGYAVHAALGLSVAEGLLIGCDPVIVEGPSDQHYLAAIKTILIRNGLLSPVREIVFPPAGGAKGIKAIASILGGRDERLPMALLDGDEQGTRSVQALRTGLYAADADRVLQVSSFVDINGAEVEDLIPAGIIAKIVDRMIREPETPFERRHDANKPIVPQIEAWANEGGVALVKGWKVELAKRVKRALLDCEPVPEATLQVWQNLFERFKPNPETHSLTA